MSTRSIFAEDDFDEIFNKYFAGLPSWECLDADISYWHNTMPHSLDLLGYRNESKNYRSDYSKDLFLEKHKILNGLSHWENNDIEYDELTLCASATTASLIVLSFLKRQQIKQIIFETPCYFASICQAHLFGFETILIPTYYKDDYEFVLSIEQDEQRPKAIWLTQPRFALGSNQDARKLKKLYAQLRNVDFLVIDEANEHLFPSTLSELKPREMCKLIKFRSLFKPLGLNGPRISCILHNNRYRSLFQDVMDITQGGIDYESVLLATDLYANPSKVRVLFDVVHNQIMELRYQAEILCQHTRLEISPIENGYLGSMHLHFDPTISDEQQRVDLLKYCNQIKLPIILGSSMYYAIEPNIEHIRLNYFIHKPLFLNGIKKLIERYHL